MPHAVPNDVIMYHEKRIEWNILISACMPYTAEVSAVRQVGVTTFGDRHNSTLTQKGPIILSIGILFAHQFTYPGEM